MRDRSRGSLPFRDALADRAEVVSDLVLQGSDDRAPLVTIAVPTYRRPELLAETIESCLAQRFDWPFEVVVVDNDPGSTGAAALIERIPGLAQASIRYYVNRQNLGVFPNWNRGIELARGQWCSILNDDDLLKPDFLALMFAEIARRPSTDGIACQKQWLDQRNAKAPPPSFSRRAAKRTLEEVQFRGAASRRIRPGKFFWGALLGNSGGFLFRTAVARQVGGFYPEDNPSSDYWFYARFASIGHLRQHRARAVLIRQTGDNATIGLVLDQLRQGHRLQLLLTHREVPGWWRRFVPLIAARHRAEFRDFWHAEVPAAELEQALDLELPRDNRHLLWLARLALGGF